MDSIENGYLLYLLAMKWKGYFAIEIEQNQSNSQTNVHLKKNNIIEAQ